MYNFSQFICLYTRQNSICSIPPMHFLISLSCCRSRWILLRVFSLNLTDLPLRLLLALILCLDFSLYSSWLPVSNPLPSMTCSFLFSLTWELLFSNDIPWEVQKCCNILLWQSPVCWHSVCISSCCHTHHHKRCAKFVILGSMLVTVSKTVPSTIKMYYKVLIVLISLPKPLSTQWLWSLLSFLLQINTLLMEQSAKSIDYDHYKELQEENQRYNPSQLLAHKLTVVSLSIYPIKMLTDGSFGHSCPFSIGQNFQPLTISTFVIYILALVYT